MGEIEDVVKVVVNDVEIPEGVSGADMTATGWYNVVTSGTRIGLVQSGFRVGIRGDPYGSMAMASVVVPNRISNGQSLPKVQVLLARAEAGAVRLERRVARRERSQIIPRGFCWMCCGGAAG